MRQISEEMARKIYDILVEDGGAANDDYERASFVQAVSVRRVTEYRFGGHLGFGGKFRNNDNSGAPYVDCYPEHRTPESDAIIARINSRLADLFAEE